MTALEKARARLKALMAELGVLEAKDTLGVADLKALEDKVAEIEADEREISVLAKAEEARARAAVPADRVLVPADGGTQPTVPATPEREMRADQKHSLIAAAVIKSKGNYGSPLKILADNGYARFAKEIEAEMRRKAVDTTVASVLIPTVVQSEIIELLRPETTFLQGNPKRVRFTHGKFTAPRGATGSTASYVGEGAKKPVTGPTFDAINMAPKKLAGIVLITQEARDWSLPDIDAYIRDDLRAALAQAMDLNAYFGTGAGNSPTGILMQGGVPNFPVGDIFADELHPTIVEIDRLASRMILSLTLANIGSSTRWKWLMNYRTLEYLKNLRIGDTFTGAFAYPELQQNPPRFKGYDVLVSNQVPINGGAGTDESTLSLIDFTHVLYGEEEGIVVKTSDQATIDVNGTLVHLFQQNMYAILSEMQHDFGLRHLEAVVKATEVRMGADLESESP